MSQDQVQHAVSRPPDRDFDENSSCDFFSYAYLSLAFFLFLSGSGLTFLVLRSDQTLNDPLNRFWMAGPLCICTGLLVALKVLLYVRRKRLIALLIREMTREQTWGRVSASPSSCDLLYILYLFAGSESEPGNHIREVIPVEHRVNATILRHGHSAPATLVRRGRRPEVAVRRVYCQEQC